MKTCSLVQTKKTADEVRGSITLDGGKLTYTPHNDFMHEIMGRRHYLDDQMLTANDTPEAWFASLPRVYNGSYFRARMEPEVLQSIASKRFSNVLKFNPHHGKDGRFTSAAGGQDDSNYLKEGAQAYLKQQGLPALGPRVSVRPDVRSNEIAESYEHSAHEPNNPRVAKSYTALRHEIDSQWDFATKKMGVSLEPWKKDGQPYPDTKAMRQDVLSHHHLYFPTEGGVPADHPLAQRDASSGYTYHDKLRAVHDLFGHAMGGFESDTRGQENAWLEHSKMFSPAAIPALTVETKGQYAWMSKMGAPAEEKATLLPTQYTDRRVKEPEFIGSPNITTGQTLEAAIAQMHSEETQKYIHAAKVIDSKLGFGEASHQVGVGMWQGGAEAAVIEKAKGRVDPDTIRAAAAMIGKISGDLSGKKKRQEAMLTWFNDPKGPHTMYQIEVPDVDVKEISSRLTKAGVQYATAIPDGHGVEVQLIHTTPASDEVAGIAKAIGGIKTKETHGYSEFINAKDYGKIVEDYQRSHRTPKAAAEAGRGVYDNPVVRTPSTIMRNPFGI